MTYTAAQLQRLWVEAGGRRAMAPLMAAIARAESSGNPAARNPSGASGLWQIMVPENAGYVPGGAGNVFNPHANAAAAVAIERSQGLGAWTTYRTGAYQPFLTGAQPGVANVGLFKTLLEGANTLVNPGETAAKAGTQAGEAIAHGKGVGSAIAEATIDPLTQSLGSLLVRGVILAAGAYLTVYGIKVALSPRETALRPVNPLTALPSAPIPVPA